MGSPFGVPPLGSPPHQIDGPVSAVLARRLRLVKLMTIVPCGRVEAGAGGQPALGEAGGQTGFHIHLPVVKVFGLMFQFDFGLF